LFKDRSLSFKTLLITWTITSAFTILFTTLQIFYEYQSEKDDLYDTYNIINDLYVAPLSESLWIMNKSIINTQANSLVNFPYVSYVKILDEDVVYFERGQSDSRSSKKFDLTYKDEKIGVLEVALNVSLLEGKFLKRVMVTVLIQGLKAVFVCILLFFAYELLITRRLRRVSNFLISNPDATSKGETIPFDTERSDELGILVKNINGFINYIFGLNKSLKSLNDDLEKKVDERTYQLKEKNVKLVEVIEDLEKAHDQLATSERLASLGKMTSGIAHEIKNPVYIIINSVALIRELLDEFVDEVPEDVKKKLDIELVGEIKDLCDRSEKSCDRVGNIINSMLSLSRASDDAKENADVGALIKSAVEFAYEAFRSKNQFTCTLRINSDLKMEKAKVYKTELSRSIINIVDNAFYSMMGMKDKTSNEDYKPVLAVDVSETEQEVIIKIKDNGLGIPDDVKKNIFNPFFTTKPAGDGTGLGMSMTYDIIKKHGGTIELTSELDEGAEFEIRIPLS
jgi:signal transduction histidine kinase